MLKEIIAKLQIWFPIQNEANRWSQYGRDFSMSMPEQTKMMDVLCPMFQICY